MATTPDYTINYDDERFTQIESDKEQALTENEQIYGGMIDNTDKYFNDMIQASKDSADKQMQIQQENTDFAIEKIEQEKEQSQKDYLKEQSGAYVDWRKQSNQYGTEAEKMASAGLANTGYSESSQVSMYNTYQNRVATAREVYNRAVLNYDNMIKDAILQNNAALAEIAANALEKQLELGLQGFQYKNSLIIEKANKKTEIDNMYYNRYQDVLQQMNTENALAEDIRQFNANQEFQAAQAELDRRFQADQAAINRKFEAEQAELNRKHEKAMLKAKTEAEKEILEAQHKKDMEKLAQQQKNEMAQLDKKLANDKALLKYESSLSGGGSGSKVTSAVNSIWGSNSSGGTKINTGNAVNTAYYSGALNPDAKTYGTFSNGYQPKGISGHGTLSTSGETITVKTQTLYGQKQTVVQNVWKAEDGTKWYWEGRQNKYIQIK